MVVVPLGGTPVGIPHVVRDIHSGESRLKVSHCFQLATGESAKITVQHTDYHR